MNSWRDQVREAYEVLDVLRGQLKAVLSEKSYDAASVSRRAKRTLALTKQIRDKTKELHDLAAMSRIVSRSHIGLKVREQGEPLTDDPRV